jgi:uncharacterized membrane-anchored protein YjiN (DUF445 family)
MSGGNWPNGAENPVRVMAGQSSLRNKGKIIQPLSRTPNDATAMKRAATGMLIAMAAIYLVSRLYVDAHPAMGFVKAFAEAAMVGGLADWFAVTALFRHPLGIPIPHTAIIPRNKDRIGDTLARFLRENFLIPSVVAKRMRRIDVAGAAGRFLSDPEHGGAGRLRDGASRLVGGLLEALDDAQLGGLAKDVLADRLTKLNVAPLLGQALDAAMRDGRHIPLLDGIISRMSLLVASNELLIRDIVHERSGRFLRWTGLDEDVADSIINAINKLLFDMADNPDHPLRIKANGVLADLAFDLRNDRAMQERVNGMKDEIVANNAVQKWMDGLWQQARKGLLKAANDPDRVLAGRLGETFRQLGLALEKEERLARPINRFFRRATVAAAATYGDSIVKLVSETVRGWDAQTITDRVENAVGRDLQYIRINGTLVGGLVGLTLHGIDVLL